MRKIFNIALISALAFGLIACKESGKSVGAADNGSISTNEIQSSTTYSYDFTYNNCKTGRQTFDSAEKLCTGLQNNTLNNNCALSFRENYFNNNCQGTFKPFSEKQKGEIFSDTLNLFDIKRMSVGSSTIDVLKTSPNGVSKTISTLSIFSCIGSINDGAHNRNNGFTLLKNSKAIINRDLNYRFRDGTSASDLKPQVAFLCDQDENNEQEMDTIEGIDYAERHLQTGHAIMEIVITSPAGIYPIQSELTYISCSENAYDAAFSGVNGVGLLKGSKLVVKRDRDYVFGDGSRPTSSAEVSVITCE